MRDGRGAEKMRTGCLPCCRGRLRADVCDLIIEPDKDPTKVSLARFSNNENSGRALSLARLDEEWRGFRSCARYLHY